MGRSGERSLFLKQLQKYGNRLWQVREQKYVTERETQTKGRTQIWENSWFFAIQKHFFWETRTRNCCFDPQNKFKKKKSEPKENQKLKPRSTAPTLLQDRSHILLLMQKHSMAFQLCLFLSERSIARASCKFVFMSAQENVL